MKHSDIQSPGGSVMGAKVAQSHYLSTASEVGTTDQVVKGMQKAVSVIALLNTEHVKVGWVSE